MMMMIIFIMILIIIFIHDGEYLVLEKLRPKVYLKHLIQINQEHLGMCGPEHFPMSERNIWWGGLVALG